MASKDYSVRRSSLLKKINFSTIDGQVQEFEEGTLELIRWDQSTGPEKDFSLHLRLSVGNYFYVSSLSKRDSYSLFDNICSYGDSPIDLKHSRNPGRFEFV